MTGGIFVPLVTPLLDRDHLDCPALERVIEHVIGGGVHGIFLLGTTGEGPLLTIGLRHEALDRAAKIVRGRVPFMVNVTGSSFTENQQLARASADAGAVAAVYAGPLYASLNQEALAAHVARFAGECPLPLYLYNMPSHTHMFFQVDTVARLAQAGHVAGLKDSSGDLLYLQKVTRALGPDFPVFVGPEEMLSPSLLGGAAGGVNGGANLLPQLFVGIYEAARRGDAVEALRLQRISLSLSEAVYGNGYLRGLKAALSARGLCPAVMAEPDIALDQAVAAPIAAAIDRPEFQPPFTR
jgi:dihydrodipicolinate synthase/N-acetylneuraminate lyase